MKKKLTKKEIAELQKELDWAKNHQVKKPIVEDLEDKYDIQELADNIFKYRKI